MKTQSIPATHRFNRGNGVRSELEERADSANPVFKGCILCEA